MKILKILSAILICGTSIFWLSACKSSAAQGATSQQVVTVQRGNLEVDITAVGNLAYTDLQELAFEIGGTINGNALTVESVLVQEGDVVKKGQVLAKLDDSAWQDYLQTLQDQLTSTQRNQTAKERAVTAAQRQVDAKQLALVQAQRQIADKQVALGQAQLNLQVAQYNLGQIADVKSAQNAVDSAQSQLNLALTLLQNAIKNGDPDAQMDDLRKGVNNAQLELAAAKANLNAVLGSTATTLTYDVATEVQTRVQAVNQAQNAVNDAQAAIDDANKAVVTAQNTLDDANTALADALTAVGDAKHAVSEAQNTLNDASAKSTEIVAPFDGFITVVNATGGQEVNKGFIACEIADPNKFESTVMVGEMDIPKVNLDGGATVSVDSLGGLTFPAKVTHIAPTATIQQGVVNYKVLVELQSLTPVQGSQQNATQGASLGQTPGQARQGASSGQASGQARQGAASGQPSGQARQGAASGQTPGQAQQGSAAQQPSAPTTPNIQLRDGMTVTVNIVVDKKQNVLMVPNGAIITQVRQSYVQVKTANGTIENRAITKGISNYQYTEVTQGLNEGEQIVITRNTTASSSTSSSQPRNQGPIFIPGVGR